MHESWQTAKSYLAAVFGDAGWSVYSPKRDVGFDFVTTKPIGGEIMLRPVQVKGLYPTAEKKDKATYGFRGVLTAVHPEMVLALPFFAAAERGASPEVIAYMPFSQMKMPARGGYRCVPAKFVDGHAVPRPAFDCFFGEPGLAALEDTEWARR